MTKIGIAGAVIAGLAMGIALPTGSSTHPQISSVDVEVDDPHPLNDAWLGLTVITAVGEKIGYVVDAPFDESGRIDFVLINQFPDEQDGGDNFIVVDGAFAERRGNHLFVDPSAPGLAAAALSVPTKSSIRS